MQWQGRAGSGAKAIGRAGLRVLPDRQRLAVRRRLGRVYPWEPGAGLAPPPCPPGMVTGPPDFVGVGAQKAGTSWWYLALSAHPDVYQPAGVHKERHFFMRYFDCEFGPHDVADYARWFPRPPGKLTGEWTPDYLYHFWIPPLLAVAAPQAKVLVLLRDPVTRWQSGVTFQHGPFGDPRRATEAYFRGRYFEQLSWLTLHIPRERVLVQQYERVKADPEGEVARTFDFLALPSADVSSVLTRRVNETLRTKRALTDGVRRDLVALYADDVRQLATAYPEIDLALWPNFRHLA
jgi:Sulfotransferase domain